MKINELIDKLKAIRDKHGDMEVRTLQDDEWHHNEIHELEVNYSEYLDELYILVK